MTGGEQEGGREEKQEKRAIPPTLHPSRRAQRGLEVEEIFTAGAAALRANTRRVNACLLMMLGAISDGFTSNYTNKQRGCWYCLYSAPQPQISFGGDFWQNASRSSERTNWRTFPSQIPEVTLKVSARLCRIFYFFWHPHCHHFGLNEGLLFFN